MKALVGPPHRDVSRIPEVPPGWEFHDAASAFVRRVLGNPSPGPEARDRAAAVVWSRPGPTWSRLRAASVLLEAATRGSGVVAFLDDVRLAQGSTESLDDVARAASGAVAWAPELDAVPTGPKVLWVETDQALLGAWPLTQTVAVTGAFAHAYWPALSTASRFVGATLEGVLPVRVGPVADLAAPEPVLFRELRQPVPAGRFAGYVTVPELLGRPLAASVAVVPVAALLRGRALTLDGAWVDWHEVTTATERWTGAGCQVAFELHVGAPGVGLESWADALEQLDQGRAGGWVLGVRPFHLPKTFEGARFGDTPIERLETPPHLGLARSTRFRCSTGLTEAEQGPAMQALAARLSTRFILAPARTALAIASGPPHKGASTGSLRVDDDCAVVEEGAGFVACNLRTGVSLRLDARLARDLQERPGPKADSERLSVVPSAQREKVRAALLAKGVLQEAS